MEKRGIWRKGNGLLVHNAIGSQRLVGEIGVVLKGDKMKDEQKAKEQRINEIGQLCQQPAELEADPNRAEDVPQKWDADYRSIFDSVNDMIVVHNARTGRPIDVNRKVLEVFGWSREEYLRLNVKDWSYGKPPYSQKEAMGWIRKAAQGKPQLFQWQCKKRNGQLFWGEVNLKLAQFRGREVVLAVVRDITERKQAEETLQESEKRFQRMAANVPGLVYQWVLHPDGSFSFPFVSAASREMFGLEPEDLMRDARILYAKIHPDDVEKFQSSVKRSAETLQPWKEEICHIINGQKRWVACNSRPEPQPNGDILWDGVMLDITGRKQVEEELRKHREHLEVLVEERAAELRKEITERVRAEEALRESEEEFRLTFENAKDTIFWADPKTGLITNCNKAAEILLEKKRGEIVGQHQTTLHPLQKAEYYANMFKKHIEQKGAVDDEAEVITKSGKIKPVHITASVTLVGGKPIIQGIFRDITERKKAEDALRESQANLQTLFNSLEDFLWVLDLKGHILRVNRIVLKRLGYLEAELLGENVLKVHPPDRHREARRIIADMKAGKAEWCPIPLMDKDGTQIPVETKVTRGHWGDQEVLFGISRDITERQRAEEGLRLEKAYFEQLFASSPEAIVVVDNDGRVQRVNSEFTRMFGYTPDEAFGQLIDDLLVSSDDLRREALALTRQVVAGREVALETVRRCKDGSLLDVSILGAPIKVGSGQVAGYAIYRDITERKRAEKALKESEKKYRTLVESAQEGIGFTDPDENIIFVNEALAELLAYKKEELLGLNLSRISDKEEFVKFRKETKKRRHGESSRYETKLYTKAGEAKYFSISATPLFDGNGTFTGTLGLLTDITERKKAEEERLKLENQLRQAQKMEAIGTLAGGVAHDFNNLLGGILGYSSLLLSKLPSEDVNHRYVELIEKASRKAAELTNRLLGFARQGKCEVKPVDINRAIQGVVELLSASIDKNIEIKADLCKDNPFTKGDPNQLEQVLINLCVNARDAMPDGGELSIGSRLVHLDEEFVSKHLGSIPGDYVRISVSDSGMGMDEETKAKIFDPFFTTKGQGEGTGLGLSMVYGIVKNHGGYLSVYSEVGKGTKFELYLPLSKGALSQPSKRRVTARAGSESILVVDDEEMLRDLMRDILRDLGYEVMLASSGEEAVKVYHEHQGKIDLVIVDMVMPRMGGKETFQELKRIDPGVRALLASGYSQNAAAQQILDLGVKGFLHKPFSMEEISRKVREVLDVG